MIRDISRLQHGPVDILVIGGGIYGSWIACHAATAGLRVALVDRSDWGSGTSSASSKLLHGGLRYLERLQFGMVRKSLQERRELNRLMPHHVRALSFLLPVYQDSRVGRIRLKAGLWLYDQLSGKGQPVPGHTSLSAAEMLQQEPSLSHDQLLGGFSYGDCGTDDSRMVLEVVESAQRAGAGTCNYVSVEHLHRTDGRVTGARLRDEETQASFDLAASIVVNAAGPWIDRQFGLHSELPQVRLTKGVHLVMPPLQSDHAVLLTAESDGRVFFLIPWYGRTLLGTTDTNYDGDPADVRITEADVKYLLNAANGKLRTTWRVSDIQGAFAGLRTLQEEAGAAASSVSREWCADRSVPGLLTSIGGKYTSARVDAGEVVAEVFAQLGRTRPSTASPAMAWYPGAQFSEWQQKMCVEAESVGIDRPTALNCTHRYGSRITDVISVAKSSPTMAQRITPELPFCRAEVVHCVRHETARSVCDVLRRRIPLMLLTRLQRQTVNDVSQLAGDVLQWDSAKRAAETEAALDTAKLWQQDLVAADAA